MRSIEAELAVDYLRRGAWIIAAILLCITAIPIWIFTVFHLDGAMPGGTTEAIALHVTLTLLMGFGASVAVFQSQGKLARHFVRPISAARLVTCEMALGIATMVAMYAVATCALNLTGAGWPIVGPTLFLAATLACSLAAIWSLEGTILGQLIGCIATTTPLVIWFSRCYGARVMGDWQRMWENPTAIEALTLGAVTALAYVVAIVGVSRVRRGDAWDFAAFRAWWERQFALLYREPRLNSAFAAQLWFEWRQKMSPLAAVLVASYMLLMFVLWSLGINDAETTLGMSGGMPIVMLALVVPLIFGLVAGNCGVEHGQRGIRYLLATRPVTDTSLALAMLRNCATGLFSAWGTWLVGFAALAALVYAAGYREAFERAVWSPNVVVHIHLMQQAIMAGAFLLISWTFASLTATMVATGRIWLWIAVFFTLFAIFLGFAILKQNMYPAAFDSLLFGWMLFSGSAYLIVTVIAFVAAVRLRLISTSIVAPAVLGWVVATAVAIYLSNQLHNTNPAWLLNVIGVLALAILPFAGMPLAVRWNRHR